MEIRLKANKNGIQSYNGLKILCLAYYTNTNLSIETSTTTTLYELAILNNNNIAHTLPKHTCNIYTILNTIAKLSSQTSKLSIDEYGMIDSWLNLIKQNIDIPYGIFLQRKQDNIKKDIIKALNTIENILCYKTYMVGDGISIVDITIICFLTEFWKEIDDNEFMNLKRLYETIIQQPFYDQATTLQNKLCSTNYASTIMLT